jgi:hypothetical protein
MHKVTLRATRPAHCLGAWCQPGDLIEAGIESAVGLIVTLRAEPATAAAAELVQQRLRELNP